MAQALPSVVLTKDDIQPPVQAVLDRPLRAHRAAELDHVARQAADDAASFRGRLLADRALADRHANRQQHDFDHIDMSRWPARAGLDGMVLAQA